MHDTAYEHGRIFFELYWDPAFTQVVELGSQDVNGSLRDHCPAGARYLGLDMEPARGVDLVVAPGQPLPLADASADVALASSAFEHDTCFWLTFLELLRILRPGGLLYINAPSNSSFHRYPLDCWRFYPDAGVALLAWAARQGVAAELLESFVAHPGAEGWSDFVAVFRRPSPRPLRSLGRIADRTVAMNICEEARHARPLLRHESAETFDMLSAARDRAALDDARTEAAEAGRRLAAATAECAAAGERAVRDAAALRDAEARVAARQAELATASRTCADLEEELRRLRASTSWRVTAPLRLAGSLLRPRRAG